MERAASIWLGLCVEGHTVWGGEAAFPLWDCRVVGPARKCEGTTGQTGLGPAQPWCLRARAQSGLHRPPTDRGSGIQCLLK